MTHTSIRFTFDGTVPIDEVEQTLRLALLAVESLHGEDRVLLETASHVERASRTCVVDTSTDVGRTLALVFAGFVRREFGDEAVTVHFVQPKTVVMPIGGGL